MDPGCYCCFCTCMDARRVAVMITKNSIRYQCPVTNVPTRDNVMVSLDIGVNFHIGRHDESIEIQTEDTKRFFYNFGPNRLEELLQEECEEGIRDFVKKIKVSRIRDIKTELTTELLSTL